MMGLRVIGATVAALAIFMGVLAGPPGDALLFAIAVWFGLLSLMPQRED